MIVKIDPKSIIFQKRIQNLCMIPYAGHPHGCTNVGKKIGCPPNQPLIDKVLDLNSEIYVIYSVFDVGLFAERMRIKHPEWRDQPRQWYNPRRWQGMARRLHSIEEDKATAQFKLERMITSPEAHGVNVTELMKSIGVTLDWQWPPNHPLNSDAYKRNKTYRVSLGGHGL
jgi:predicted metal-binding protein